MWHWATCSAAGGVYMGIVRLLHSECSAASYHTRFGSVTWKQMWVSRIELYRSYARWQDLCRPQGPPCLPIDTLWVWLGNRCERVIWNYKGDIFDDRICADHKVRCVFPSTLCECDLGTDASESFGIIRVIYLMSGFYGGQNVLVSRHIHLCLLDIVLSSFRLIAKTESEWCL